MIVQYCDVKKVEKFFNRILKAEFTSFKLNIEAEEEVILPFQLNELQIEDFVYDTIDKVCTEYSEGIKKGSDVKSTKLKKDDLEEAVESIKSDLSTSLERVLKASYSSTHKASITDRNLSKCVDFFNDNRVFIINKYGRFDFN